MLSFSSLLQPKSVKFLNSGLDLTYSIKDMLVGIDVRGTKVNVPIDYRSLDIVSTITSIVDDARSGYMLQNVWENPKVQDLNKRISPAQRIALGYYIILSFLWKCETRDIWKVFKGQMHHSLISYLRNRVISREMALQYKVAILSCYLANYNITDIAKVEQTFINCGLSSDNYIFYFLLCLDQMNSFEFDKQERFILSTKMLDREAKDFIETPQIKKLCLYHTHKSLSFIVSSHKIAPEDLASELQIATQQSYSIVRPFKTRAYCENYSRRTMTNMVARIQHAFTKYEENIRLVKTENGDFQNTHIMFDDNGGIVSSGGRGSKKSVGNKDFETIDRTFESLLTSSVGFSEDVMISYLDARYQ